MYLQNFLSENWWEAATLEEVFEELAKGAEVDVRAENGLTAFSLAVSLNGNPEVIKLLIDHGADIYARDDFDRTPLMLAAEVNSHAEIAKLLIDCGLDVNWQNEYGEDALVLACEQNSNPM